MSREIDEKIVSMQFDNSKFEQNVSTSMNTVDKLKKSLNFEGASKGFSDIDRAANKISFSGLTNGIEAIQTKFSYMQATIQHQINNIVDSAVSAGKRIVSALTVDPIKTGFSEYETQINAVQTILANTSSKGTTLTDVNKALDTLNTYADKTIYNFTEMTRNIGTFTAAGIDLDTSVTAIQGIANLAAVSGSTSQQASTAMYQLSQALASGTVKLMDWNSVVNAGMGGQVFQDALKETARAHGIAIDQLIEDEGSFRETLQKGWLTSDVLTETLAKFTMTTEGLTEAEIAKNREMLKGQGYTEAQIDEIFKLGATATDAATKVKTFTQLFDTLKEAAQSGWTQTWEILVGDFEEAKGLLTGLSNYFGEIINKSAEARNSLLEGWKEGGGRTMLLESFKNVFEGLLTIIKPIKEAFGEIFPPLTVEQLLKFTEGLKNLTEKFKLSDTQSKNLKSTFKGLFAAMDIVSQAFFAIVGGVKKLLGIVPGVGDGILGVTGKFGEWIVKLDEFLKKNETFEKAIDGIINILQFIPKKISEVFRSITGISIGDAFDGIKESISNSIESLKDLIGSIGDIDTSGISTLTDKIKERFKPLSAIFDGFKKIFTAIGEFFRKFAPVFGMLAAKLGEALGGVGEGLYNAIKNADFEKIYEIINGGVLVAIGVGIKKFIDSLSDLTSNASGFIGGITGIFDGLKGCLQSFQQSLKAKTLMTIAGAIALLTASIVVLSMIDSEKLNSALVAIAAEFTILFGSMGVFQKIMSSDGFKGMSKIATMMVAMALAVLILSAAVKKLSTLDWEELTKGLVGVAGLAAVLVVAAKLMSSNSKAVVKGATQMLIMAAAIKIMASACEDLSKLSWEGIAKGVAGIGAILLEFVGFQALVKLIKPKKLLSSAVSLVIIGAAMEIFANVCKKFSGIEWSDMGKAGVAMAGVLALAAGFGALSKFTKKMVSSSIALVLIGAAMEIFADVCKKFGTIGWDELAKSGVAMAGILVLAAGFGLLSGLANKMTSSVIALTIMAVALEIMANVCAKFGSMEWEGLAKAGVAIAGILVLAAGFALLAGLSSGILVSSAALLVMAAALLVLTPVLKALGDMTWGEIAKGLITIAGAFAIIGVAGLLLAPLTPAILGLAAAFAIFGVGMAAIGVGVLALSAGLTGLAVAGTAAAASLVASLRILIVGIIDLIPEIVLSLGAIIVAVCDVLIQSAPKIAEATKALLLSTLDILVECIPPIVDGLLKLVVAILDSLVEYTPTVVSRLYDIFIGIINATAEKLPGLIKAGVNLIESFFSGVLDAFGDIDIDTILKGTLAVGAMAGVMAALSAVAGLIPGAMLGVLGLGGVIAELALVLAAVGALSQIPGLNWLINEGGELLGNIGTAIGSFIGGIVGGIMGGITSQFPKIGQDLSDFMTNVKPFIEGASSIDRSMLDGVKALAEVILLLTAANVIEGLTSWFTGGSSLSKFATELVPFGKAMKEYANEVKDIDGDLITKSAIAGKTLAEMAETLPNSGGVVGFFTGENDLKDFTAQIVPFGKAMKEYADEVKGIDGDAVESSTIAGKALSEMASTIPNCGGVVGFFTGENNLDEFARQIVPFGKAMKSYAEEVAGIDGDAVESSANAGKALSEMASTVPNCGGVVGFFKGENGLDDFANQIVPFGKAMKEYSDAVEGINESNITASSTAGKTLAELAKTLPEDPDSVIGLFSKRTDLETFGQQLKPFGKAMKDYSDAIDGINAGAVTASAEAGKMLAGIANSLPTDPGSVIGFFSSRTDLETFGVQVTAFGSAMKSYSNSVDGIKIDKVEASVSAGKALADISTMLNSNQGIFAVFSADSGMIDLANQLVPFGRALTGYSNAVEGVQSNTIVTSTVAARKLIELAQDILYSDEFSIMFGNTINFATFGSQIVEFGSALSKYSAVIGTVNAASIENSVTAGKALADMFDSFPTSGGLLSLITGESTFGAFKDNLVPFGRALRDYSASVSDLDSASVISSTNAGKSVAEMISAFPTENLEIDLSGLSSNVIKMGVALRDYSSSVSGLDSAAVSAAVLETRKLLNLMKDMAGFESLGANAFSEGLNNLAKTSIDGFVNTFTSSYNRVSTVANEFMNKFTMSFESATTKTQEIANKIVTAFVDALSAGNGRVTNAAKNMFTTFISAVNSQRNAVVDSFTVVLTASLKAITSKIDAFKQAGKKLMSSFISGIKTNSNNISSSFTSVLDSCLKTLYSYEGMFMDAGLSVASGFADGITAGTFAAEASAKAMADAAYEAARKELDVNSPSKVFRKLAGSVPEGFAQGIDKFGGLVKNSATDMAQTAIDSTSNALMQISDVTNSNLDVTPTIRPVFDMTNIESGNLKLNADVSGYITQPVNSLAQIIAGAQDAINTSNNEVLTAINNLRDDLNIYYKNSEEKETALYVDSKKLASSIAKPMNRQLNILAQRGAY